REPHVLRPVADHPGGGQVQVQSRLRRLRHAGPGLAVLAGPGERADGALGVVRAVREHVDVRAVLGQMVRDVPAHRLGVVDAVQAPGYAGLVGDHRHRDPGPVEPGDGGGRAVDELDSVNGADVAVVDDDGAVAVEQDAGPASG